MRPQQEGTVYEPERGPSLDTESTDALIDHGVSFQKNTETSLSNYNTYYMYIYVVYKNMCYMYIIYIFIYIMSVCNIYFNINYF